MKGQTRDPRDGANAGATRHGGRGGDERNERDARDRAKGGGKRHGGRGTPGQVARRPARRPRQPPRVDPLLELLADEFLFAREQTSTSPATLASYRQVLRVFRAHLEHQLGRPPRLSDFTLPAAQEWAISLQRRPRFERGGLSVGDRPLAVESRRTYLRTLRTFSNWLPKPPHRYCDEPPLAHLLLPRPPDTYKLPLTTDELSALLAAAKEESIFGARDTAMLLFLVDSAMRASELARLRIGDVTL